MEKLLIFLMLIICGCALPVTRSLDNISDPYLSNKMFKGSEKDESKVMVGMTKEEIVKIIGKPAKIFKQDNTEYWIYFPQTSEWGNNTRWIIPPFIPIGRIHYKLIFNHERLNQILLKTMDYL